MDYKLGTLKKHAHSYKPEELERYFIGPFKRKLERILISQSRQTPRQMVVI